MTKTAIIIDFGKCYERFNSRFIVLKNDNIKKQLLEIFKDAQSVVIDSYGNWGRIEFKYNWYEFEYHVAESFV